MKNSAKGRMLKIIAIIIDVAAPLAATLTLFPVWIDRSAKATMSGGVVFILAICCIPLWKQIKEFFKSPSIAFVWIVAFVMLYLLQSIISEMLIVCFAGAVSNIIGAGIYKLGDFVEKKPKKKKQESEI